MLTKVNLGRGVLCLACLGEDGTQESKKPNFEISPIERSQIVQTTSYERRGRPKVPLSSAGFYPLCSPAPGKPDGKSSDNFARDQLWEPTLS